MSRRIYGYASLFGVPDLAGDEIVPGAFRRGSGRLQNPPPMLYQHDATRPVGRWTVLRETPRGLWVEGELAKAVGLAEDVAALIRQDILSGLSIGFRTRRAAAGRGRVKRRLLDIELVEISLVTFPMQPQARLYGMADADTDEPDLPLAQARDRLAHLINS